MKNIIIFLVALLVFSCNQQKKAEREELHIENKEMPAEARAEKTLHDEVMAIHDEVMPKMDDMMRLKGQLQTKLDMARESGEAGEDQLKDLQDAIAQLEAADEAMMQWMRNFRPSEDADHEAVMQYYERQKKKMEEVRDQMLAAMENARKELD